MKVHVGKLTNIQKSFNQNTFKVFSYSFTNTFHQNHYSQNINITKRSKSIISKGIVTWHFTIATSFLGIIILATSLLLSAQVCQIKIISNPSQGSTDLFVQIGQRFLTFLVMVRTGRFWYVDTLPE